MIPYDIWKTNGELELTSLPSFTVQADCILSIPKVIFFFFRSQKNTATTSYKRKEKALKIYTNASKT